MRIVSELKKKIWMPQLPTTDAIKFPQYSPNGIKEAASGGRAV